MNTRLKRLLSLNASSLTIAIAAGAVALFLSGLPILDLLEMRAYDLRFHARGPLPPSPAIALAMIDEKSLDVEGRWPWPRAKLATLIDRLSQDGAKVIAFDIGFLEPDQNSDLELLDRVDETVGGLSVVNPDLKRLLQTYRERADNDGALARAIRDSSAAVVLGYFFHMSEKELEYAIDPAEIQRRFDLLATSKYPIVTGRDADAARSHMPAAYAPEINLTPITQAAEASGYFTVKQDADSIVRWMPLVIRGGNDLYPPLSVLAVYEYLDQPILAVHAGRYGIERIQLGERFIPTDGAGRLLINYLGPPKTFAHFSVGDIIEGKVAAGTFRDRIVLVGASATGVYDVRSTPFSPTYPGAEIHATVIDNLLTGNVMAKPGWLAVADVAAIIALVLVAGIVLPRVSALAGLLFAAAAFALYILFVREAFIRYGLWLNIVYPPVALTVTYTALTAYRFLHEQRERRKVRSAFGQYVSPVVVEEMLKDPDRLKLGGEEKLLTVLFSDLQGFTSYSERYTPQQMIELLSEYYARMTERVFAREGMLKEYVGDELMAIFGAPIEHADHAERACMAALEMRAHRNAMSEEWVRTGRPPLYARTGVNSGRMLVGNLGSEYRFAYGVLGDNVNLGSRLEGMNKEYATEILIGENTAELLKNGLVMREVDVVRVVGKKKPTRIFELVSISLDELTKAHRDALGVYAEALAAYRAQRWKDALGLFEEVLRLRPEDGPSKTMMRRMADYRESPLPEDWDGVFEATRK